MNFDAPDAPTHAVPHTRWWLWAAAALALHLCAAALVWWWVRWPMQVVGIEGEADSEQVGALDVQRWVWVDTGIQAATPAFETVPTPTSLEAQQAMGLATPAQTTSQPKSPEVDVAVDVATLGLEQQPKPSQSTQSTGVRTNAVPTNATTAFKHKVADQTAQPAALDANLAVEQQAAANSAPSVLQAYSPPPAYPALSQRLGEQGDVLLRVQVSAAGKALAIELSKPSGFERLDRAAIQAVSTWRFAPAMVNGQARAAWFEVPVRFELR